jgi:hypothetical protein
MCFTAAFSHETVFFPVFLVTMTLVSGSELMDEVSTSRVLCHTVAVINLDVAIFCIHWSSALGIYGS